MSKPVMEDIFAFSGRRNRLSYLLYQLAIMVAIIVLWLVLAGLVGASSSGGPLVIGIIVSIALAFSGMMVAAQRCRDFGWTGWAILITLIPFIGWIFPIAIFFVPGTQGSNRYGPDPLARM